MSVARLIGILFGIFERRELLHDRFSDRRLDLNQLLLLVISQTWTSEFLEDQFFVSISVVFDVQKRTAGFEPAQPINLGALPVKLHPLQRGTATSIVLT